MFEFAKLVHETFGYSSPKIFISIAAIVGAVVFGGVAFLIDRSYQIGTTQNQQAKMTLGTNPHSEPPRAPQAETSSRFLWVESRIVTSGKFSPSGRTRVLYLWGLPPGKGTAGALGELTGTPGTDLGLPPRNISYETMCSNYYGTVLLNVRIPLHLTFREAVRDDKQPNAFRSGNVTIARDLEISFPKLDPGELVSFFVANSSNNFVDVSFPDAAFAQVGDRHVTIPLLQPEARTMILAPFKDPIEQK